jgi:drug/metabolite transporter (DMT)-like permease
MVAVYVAVMRGQDDQPLMWVIAVLVCGALLAAYGAVRRLPLRRVALGAATALLGVIGLLAIFTIGLPILVAAALSGVALLRIT